jgi:hypothetical protein
MDAIRRNPPLHSADGSTARQPAKLRLAFVVGLCLCTLFIIFGVVTAWQDIVQRPQTYERLRDHGRQANAQLVSCSHRGCTLTLTYAGDTRKWLYPANRKQFNGLTIGAAIPVLVDPDHPQTVYTVRDVNDNTNAGWSPTGIYSLFLLVLGLVGLYGLTRAIRAYRRAYGSLLHPVVPQR